MLMSHICLTNEDFSLGRMNDKALASLQQQDVLEARWLLSYHLAALWNIAEYKVVDLLQYYHTSLAIVHIAI